jgi:hypothetical protein
LAGEGDATLWLPDSAQKNHPIDSSFSVAFFHGFSHMSLGDTIIQVFQRTAFAVGLSEVACSVGGDWLTICEIAHSQTKGVTRGLLLQ